MLTISSNPRTIPRSCSIRACIRLRHVAQAEDGGSVVLNQIDRLYGVALGVLQQQVRKGLARSAFDRN